MFWLSTIKLTDAGVVFVFAFCSEPVKCTDQYSNLQKKDLKIGLCFNCLSKHRVTKGNLNT